VYIVGALPKTRSGKILRAAIRGIVNGADVGIPPTIENPDALSRMAELMRSQQNAAPT